jgi:arylsulfatase A-like enzyme
MKKVTRRDFIAGAAGATAYVDLANAQARNRAASRPNIIFILADDLGWADLSCYGRPDYKTPNLDRLASQGVRFTNAYSAAPVCSPTRVGFHTGRYPARLAVGLEEPIQERMSLGEKIKTMGIPLQHPTVSSIIRSAGYDTALIGKWHLGYLPHFSPIKFGFDEFFGITSGAVDHFSHRDMMNNPDLYESEVPVEKVGYLTDLLTDRAVDYVRQKRSRPFYLSLHYTAPHWPWEGPLDKNVSEQMKYSPAGFRAGGSLKIYAEMMRSMDSGVGRVLDALKRTRHEQNTLIIFTSDNGGERFSFNWPFRGQKLDLQEGGVRVPGLVRWPGITRAGKVSHQPVITMDWTATMIAAAGATPAPDYPLDGIDLADLLRSSSGATDRTFYWRTRRQGAVRSGKWKYIREGKTETLHDLSIDEREQANFADSHPEMLTTLRRRFNDWESRMVPYPPA